MRNIYCLRNFKVSKVFLIAFHFFISSSHAHIAQSNWCDVPEELIKRTEEDGLVGFEYRTMHGLEPQPSSHRTSNFIDR